MIYNFKKCKSILRKNFIINTEEGFTIVELLIVMAIISLLASIAVPSALKWVDREKQNSYIRELISYLELVKKETRRWNGSCNIQTNTFATNPTDPFSRKKISLNAFTVSCSGMDKSNKKNITNAVPKIDSKVFQEVNQRIFNFTPKGHLSIPGNQDALVIIVGGRPNSNLYQKPKCIILESPIGMINTGIYQNTMRFYSGRFGSSQNSSLRKQNCKIN
tara:strand:- start:401 stop:1057 length:657 start_codon:yes stop_codon:yes gene_type:complete